MTTTPPEARLQAERGDAIILDVRGHDEWRSNRIPGALHIPLHELQQRMDELPRDKTVICQCASGARSASAAAFLRQAGFETLNLHGGIGLWASHGLPVE